MSARLFRLDAFEQPAAVPSQTSAEGPEPDAVHLRAARDEGYAKGFTDGATQATEAARAIDAALIASIREALDDIRLTRAMVQAETERKLADLVSAILHRIMLPAAAEAFGTRLVAAIREVLASQSPETLTVHVSSDDAAAFGADIPEGVVIATDPTLSRGAARIETEAGGRAFDIPETVAAIAAILEDQTETEDAHDQQHTA